MNSLYDSRQLLKYLFIVAAVVIAIASVFVSDLLIKDLAREERQRLKSGPKPRVCSPAKIRV